MTPMPIQRLQIPYAERLSCNTDGENLMFQMTAQAVAIWADQVDRLLTNMTIQAARDAGISDIFILDREFICAAIREKIERESGRRNKTCEK